jgi:TolB protein
MNDDGTGQTRLTDGLGAYSPAWSPDGRRIVFTSNEDRQVYVMNADGSDHVRLTNNTGVCLSPRGYEWSPDGQRIAFTSTRFSGKQGGQTEICEVNADGSGLTRLTNAVGDDQNPTWSPDGRRIAFESHVGNVSYLSVMNADGSDHTYITTQSSSTYMRPKWSPDGRRIAFAANLDGNSSKIYLINADGSNLTGLHYGPAGDPTWSPDGRYIVFAHNQSDNRRIMKIKVDGSDIGALASGGLRPTWSPDGSRIAYGSWSRQCSCTVIFVVNDDRTGHAKLTVASDMVIEDQYSNYISWAPIAR